MENLKTKGISIREFKIKRNVFGYKKTYNIKNLIIDEKKDFRYIKNKILNEDL